MSRWPEDAADVPVNCGICHERMTGADIFEHLLTEHGVDAGAEMLRWPDGEPVVIDSTLEPDDFAEGRS